MKLGDKTISDDRSIHRKILAVALPAILANLSAALPGLADTAFIGQHGDAIALGGIALGNRLAYFALWAFGFLRLSAGGVTAQAYGAHDYHALQNNVYRALLVATSCGLLIWIFAYPLGHFTLPLFGAEDRIREQAFRYWSWRAISAPFDFLCLPS